MRTDNDTSMGKAARLRGPVGGARRRRGIATVALLAIAAACSSNSSKNDGGPIDAGMLDAPSARDGAVDSPEAGATAANRPERRDVTAALVSQLKVPPGFRVSVFAQALENPRMMAVADDGAVYVTVPHLGQVVRLADGNGDGDAADLGEAVVVASKAMTPDLDGVHGITFSAGKLYLASVKSIFVAAPGATQLTGLQKLVGDLPDGGQHPNRTLAVGPDGKLYVSVGSSCNACAESDSEHGTLLRLELTGTPSMNPPDPAHPLLARDPTALISPRVFASGLRNTLGFDWHPTTHDLWGWDMGSDGLGDELPPDEINRIQGGKSYGWPYCWGDRQVDPTVDTPTKNLSKEDYCANTQPNVAGFQAHSSPVGLLFYRGSQFPAEYQGDAFAALRGSWNRTTPTGYKVVRVHFQAGVPTPVAGSAAVYRDFLTGFLIDNGAAQFGRIAGLAVAADGGLLVAEDTNGMIYKVTYDGGGGGAGGAGGGGAGGRGGGGNGGTAGGVGGGGGTAGAGGNAVAP